MAAAGEDGGGQARHSGFPGTRRVLSGSQVGCLQGGAKKLKNCCKIENKDIVHLNFYLTFPAHDLRGYSSA